MRDDALRSSCFASLDVLCARYGEEVPYRDGLDQGFPFRGRRVPFLSAQYEVHVSARLLDEDDGPMLDVLKTFHREPIVLPQRRAWRPDRDRLAVRFDRFTATAG
jgi:hypothetical protein